jgi:pyrimidine operon attenuation protein / uracil phosphoribosyltransferase
MSKRRVILTADVAVEKLHRMALEIAEQLSNDDEELVIIGIEGAGKFGIKGAGKFIASKIAAYLEQYISCPLKLISLHLDKHAPSAITLSEEMNFDNKNILLIDDVSNSGKTLLYALKPLMQFQPKRISNPGAGRKYA